MRWEPGQKSDDVEDRRAESGGGAGRFIPGGVRGLGLGGVLIVAALSLVFRQNLFALLGSDGAPVPAATGPASPGPARQASPQEERAFQLVNFVVDDVQRSWEKEFAGSGRRYRHAKVVIFRDAWPSGCGDADAGSGPFYCPADEKVYLDLGFYEELRQRFGAPGEFAQAYVVAHEIGHHVQQLLGIADKVHQAQRAHPEQGNALSVRLELQADCLAGVWGHSTGQRSILVAGDLESGLAAAAAVGDDRMQRQATGRVNPERWTHGASAQRVAWFKRGFQDGRLSACDTFSQQP